MQIIVCLLGLLSIDATSPLATCKPPCVRAFSTRLTAEANMAKAVRGVCLGEACHALKSKKEKSAWFTEVLPVWLAGVVCDHATSVPIRLRPAHVVESL